MKRLFRWRRLRWFVLGGTVRFVLRRTAARSVDQATADIEARLPMPVKRALEVMPADAVRAGGSAVVAARSAKRVAVGTQRVTRATSDQGRRLTDAVTRVRSLGTEIGRESEYKRRELKADYLRATEGNGPADDELLDLRSDAAGDRSLEDHNDDLPEVEPPVRSGRWRAERRIGAGAVARVQRSYRPRPRPWDR